MTAELSRTTIPKAWLRPLAEAARTEASSMRQFESFRQRCAEGEGVPFQTDRETLDRVALLDVIAANLDRRAS